MDIKNIDWSEAPAWADRVIRPVIDNVIVENLAWSNDSNYQYINGETIFRIGAFISFQVVEKRPDDWKEGEERMNDIAQNGNDGHYEELDDFSKQPRYKDENGLDWIDEFAANNSIEGFRAAMRFTIGKYERRLGKKDAMSKELYKIADYYKRWSQVESEQEK